MAEYTIQEKLARIEELANSGLKHAAAQLSRLILEDDVNSFEALIWLARTSNQPDEVNKATDRAAQLRPNDPAVRDLLYNGNRQTSNNSASYNPATPPPPTHFSSPPPATYMPPSYTPPTTNDSPASSASAYDYLKNLNSSVATPPPPAPTVEPLIKSTSSSEGIKVKRGPNPVPLVIGLLFLLGGLIGAIWWALMVVNFNGSPTNQVQAQITNLISGDSKSVITIQPKDSAEKREYQVSQNFVSTITPLITDSKNKGSIAPNSVIVNLNSSGRLISIDVISPTKGIANNNLSLVGMGLEPVFDWIFVVIQLLVAVIGLMLIGLAVNRKTV